MKFKKNLKMLCFAVTLTTIYSLLSTFCFAGDTADSLPYLRMGVGARAMGMGGAFVSVADDASAAYWNPGGLAKIDKAEISAMYSLMSLDRSLNWLNFVLPTSFGTLGVGLINAGVSDINGFDLNQVATGKFSYSSTAVLLSYANKLEETMSAGVNLKVISDSLGSSSRSGIGADIGILASPTEKMNFGLKLQDIAETVGSDSVPMTIAAGASYRVMDNKLLLSADLNKIAEVDTPKLNLGVEYAAAEILSVQAGLNDSNFCFGTTFNLKHFNLAYAYAVDPIKSGDRHLISFGAKF